MGKILTGGCQCGAVSYSVNPRPFVVYACHCKICQKQSGSAFGMAAVFPLEALSVDKAHLRYFIRAGHGRRFRCYFCDECGTRLYHQWFTADGDYPFVNIKPGTLDDTEWLVPGCHVWTESAQRWVSFKPSDVIFAQQPDLEDMPKFISMQTGMD